MINNHRNVFVANSFAAFTAPLYGKVFFTAVRVINPKNNKGVNIIMLADTGAQNSQIDGTKYAKALGIDMKTGVPSTCTGTAGSMECYRHSLTLQLPGGIQPLTNVPVYLTTQVPLFNNLGWTNALEKLQVTVKPTSITYTEFAAAKAAATQAALGMVNSQAHYRSRY